MSSERSLSTTGQPSGSNSLQSRKGITTDFLAIQQVPSDPGERAHLSKIIGGNLLGWLEERLAPPDRELLRKHGLSPPDDSAGARIRAELDGLIIEQALILGPRIFASDAALNRILQWHQSTDNGPALLAKLGEQLTLGARVRRGQAKMPIDKKSYASRNDIKAELRTLQNYLRVTLAGRRRVPRGAESISLIERQVKKPGNPFPWLRQVWTAFRSFLEQNPETASDLAKGGGSTAQISIALFAWSHGRDYEATRQAISTIGRTKQRPQIPK